MRSAWGGFRLSALIGLALAGCGGTAQESLGALGVAAQPTSILDGQQSSTLTVAATDAQGKPGTGWVLVSSQHGVLDPYGYPESTLGLTEGKVTVRYSCSSARDSCIGKQVISARWMDLRSSVSIAVVAVDAGTVDAGSADGGRAD